MFESIDDEVCLVRNKQKGEIMDGCMITSHTTALCLKIIGQGVGLRSTRSGEKRKAYWKNFSAGTKDGACLEKEWKIVGINEL